MADSSVTDIVLSATALIAGSVIAGTAVWVQLRTSGLFESALARLKELEHQVRRVDQLDRRSALAISRLEDICENLQKHAEIAWHYIGLSEENAKRMEQYAKIDEDIGRLEAKITVRIRQLQVMSADRKVRSQAMRHLRASDGDIETIDFIDHLLECVPTRDAELEELRSALKRRLGIDFIDPWGWTGRRD